MGRVLQVLFLAAEFLIKVGATQISGLGVSLVETRKMALATQGLVHHPKWRHAVALEAKAVMWAQGKSQDPVMEMEVHIQVFWENKSLKVLLLIHSFTYSELEYGVRKGPAGGPSGRHTGLFRHSDTEIASLCPVGQPLATCGDYFVFIQFITFK